MDALEPLMTMEGLRPLAAVREDGASVFADLDRAGADSGRQDAGLSRPGSPAQVAGLASAQLQLGQPEAAFALLAHHQAGQGPHPVLLRLAARALLAMGRRREAIGSLYAALGLDGVDAETLGLLGDALFQNGDAVGALAPSQAAFDLQPTAAHATTLGCVLTGLGRDADALVVADRGLQHRPDTPELWLNRSIALEGLDRRPEAVESARQALRLAPGSPLAQHHLAAALLTQGEMTEEAWTLYEGRLRLNGTGLDAVQDRRWHGEAASGRTILLHAEQGLGDTLQFARYVPLVVARGARVVLAVQPSLVQLLEPMVGPNQVVAVGNGLPPFDAFAPLLSLPGLFGTTLDSIPPPLPIGITPRPRVDGALHVGLAWAGNPGFVADRQRSVAPTLLDALADVPGVVFHSLQVGTPDAPQAIRFASDLAGVRDFADTASRMAGLDLVISVDTAVIHLAGCLGLPVWLMSRFRGCWRWLHGRADSPWYPRLRIFRQARPNDWLGVITCIRADLEALARHQAIP